MNDVRFIDEVVGAVWEEVSDTADRLVAASGSSVEEEFSRTCRGGLKGKLTVYHDDAVTRDG